MNSNNFQMGHCEDCLMYRCEISILKDTIKNLEDRIEQLEKDKNNLYDRCLENEEVMYDAVIRGNDNKLIELVEKGIKKI